MRRQSAPVISARFIGTHIEELEVILLSIGVFERDFQFHTHTDQVIVPARSGQNYCLWS